MSIVTDPSGIAILKQPKCDLGDLRIVADHAPLMCSDDDCHENAIIACSLLKEHIKRLARYEKAINRIKGWVPHNHAVGRVACEDVECPRAALAHLDGDES